MTNFIKKQTIGTWLSLVALVLVVVATIIYGVNVASTGVFKGMSSTPVVVCSVFEIILLVAVLVLSQIHISGYLGQVLCAVIDALKIVAGFLPMIAMIVFLKSRMYYLGIYLGSSEDVLSTIQTAENMSSCYTAITGIIFYGITMLVALVAAFFTPEKAAKKEQAAA